MQGGLHVLYLVRKDGGVWYSVHAAQSTCYGGPANTLYCYVGLGLPGLTCILYMYSTALPIKRAEERERQSGCSAHGDSLLTQSRPPTADHKPLGNRWSGLAEQSIKSLVPSLSQDAPPKRKKEDEVQQPGREKRHLDVVLVGRTHSKVMGPSDSRFLLLPAFPWTSSSIARSSGSCACKGRWIFAAVRSTCLICDLFPEQALRAYLMWLTRPAFEHGCGSLCLFCTCTPTTTS